MAAAKPTPNFFIAPRRVTDWAKLLVSSSNLFMVFLSFLRFYLVALVIPHFRRCSIGAKRQVSARQGVSAKPWIPSEAVYTPTIRPPSLTPIAIVWSAPGGSTVAKAPALSRRPCTFPLVFGLLKFWKGLPLA
jgi:hypothetical protein